MASFIHFDRLSSGMPVGIQTSDESKLLSIAVWINAGSAFDPVDKGGLAHLCEHLLLRPLSSADSRAHRIQLKTGALVNACTDPEWVVISAQVPCEQSQTLIDLLSSLVREPCCGSEGLEVEKEVILRELRETKPGPAESLIRTFKESAFAKHPCFQPIGGTPATLGALTISDVQGYYSRFLHTSQMLITAYGATRSSDLTVMLEEAFAGLPHREVFTDSSENRLATTAQAPPDYCPVRIPKDLPTAGSVSGYGVLAGLATVPRRTDHFWTALAFELLMADGPGSLLSQWLRNEHRWMYGAVSMTEAFSNWGIQYFLMRISPERIEEAVACLARQWRTLPELVTEERVAALRNHLVSRALSSLANQQDRMTLMRDSVLVENRQSYMQEGGLDVIIARHVAGLNPDSLHSYIRQHAQWDRVSLVCAPM